MTGAVLNPLNYRLDARTLTFMLGHAEAKILIVDREYSKLVSSVLATFPPEKRPFVIDVDDPLCYLVSENLKTIVFSRRDQGTQPGSAEFLLRISWMYPPSESFMKVFFFICVFMFCCLIRKNIEQFLLPFELNLFDLHFTVTSFSSPKKVAVALFSPNFSSKLLVSLKKSTPFKQAQCLIC